MRSSVRKHPTRGKWIADVGTVKDGNRERRSFDTKREAVEFANAAIARKETTGHFTPKRKSPTVVEAYQLWLDSRIHEIGCREVSITNYRNLGKSQLCVWAADEPEIPASKDRYGLARLKLSELTERIVQNWVDQLLREVVPKTGRKLSPLTVRYALSMLRGVIKYARRKGVKIDDDCVQLVLDWFGDQKSLRPRKLVVGIDIPTEDDANAYLRSATRRGLMHEAMELLKVHCGLRISEVCGLLWSDIDFDNLENGEPAPVMHIRHTAG